jgi:hypothetical protein
MYFMVVLPKKYLSLKHRYACLGFETCHNICLMVVRSFFHPLCVHTLSQKSLQSTSLIIIFGLLTLGGNLLHIKITHFNSVASVVITSVVSVTYCLQVFHLHHKCRKFQKHHTSILPMSCL